MNWTWTNGRCGFVIRVDDDVASINFQKYNADCLLPGLTYEARLSKLEKLHGNKICSGNRLCVLLILVQHQQGWFCKLLVLMQRIPYLCPKSKGRRGLMKVPMG
mmetsp:Transcript_16096/g.38640  ORF Transcript_16096/g.38640 Transcript_16096/m.38640 type:complete len:104 (-) Transcript_16096:20-331(-)